MPKSDSPSLPEDRSPTEIEQAALHVDPWGDGKCDDYYRVLSNRIVTCRKPHECAVCFGAIPIGSRVRAQTEQSNDYGVKTFYICAPCVHAFGLYGLGDGDDSFMERYEIGRRNAERMRANG